MRTDTRILRAALTASALVALTAAPGPAQTLAPCTALSTADVQRVLPGTGAGQPDEKLASQGIHRCVWKHDAGTLLLILGDGEEESLMEEAKGWTLTFLDPLRPDAETHVRFDKLTGVGDEAIAVVERPDQAKGFARDGAILVVRRGKRQIALLATGLARRERADALGVLAELGKAAARRMP